MNKGFLDAYDYYMRFHYDMENGIPPGDPQHELMAAHYRDIIQDAIKEFDNSFDEEIYEALAWVGLMGKGIIDDETGLPPAPTIVWEQKSQSDRLEILSIRENFHNTNDQCQ